MSYTWTDPTAHVYAVGEAVTAGTLNTYVQQNLAVLGQNKAAVVATLQTTTSTTFTDLATGGPQVTINTMTSALISLTATLHNNTAGDYAVMGFSITGATTVAAVTTSAIYNVGTGDFTWGGQFLVTGLTPGANTFTAKYEVTPAGTGSFSNRNLVAEALSS